MIAAARLRVGALLVATLYVALLLGGCALVLPQAEGLRERWPAGLADRAEIASVPFFPQKDYQCGPAALATLLAFDGVAATPDDLVAKVYLPERRGSLQIEMLAAARGYGTVSSTLAPRLDDVLREVAAGNPVIVLQDYGVWPVAVWHYAVVVGYDREAARVVLRSGEKARLEMPFPALEYTWKKSGYWAMVALPPDRVAATASEAGWAAAVAAMERVAPAPAALSGYRALLARWPDSLAGAIGLANAAYAGGDLRSAEGALRAAVARHPDSAVAWNNLAQVLFDLRRDREALQAADAAVALGGPFRAAAEATRRQIRERLGAGG